LIRGAPAKLAMKNLKLFIKKAGARAAAAKLGAQPPP